MSDTDRRESASRGVHPRRARAYELLAAGVAISAVARELKVKPHTIIAWRDSEEGHREVTAFALKLADARHGELLAAEKRLGRLAGRAVTVLGELLECDDPNVRLKASIALADRGGLPKTERVEVKSEEHDYSGLTDEELRTLRAAQEIQARKKGTPG